MTKAGERLVRCSVLAALLCLLAVSTFAQSREPFTLTAPQLQNGKAVALDKLAWKYAPGDEPRFAEPQFDERAWETLNGTAITLNNIPKSGWRGIGWFRLRLQVDPALANQPLALVLVHYGASEIYLDGKLVERFGTVGTTPETEVAYNPNTLPLYFVLDARGEHVIAVRHSCMELRDLSGGWGRWLVRQSIRMAIRVYTNRTIEYGAGFGMRIVAAAQSRDEREARRFGGSLALLSVGLLAAIGFLHLLLFRFYPRQRANLFFGLFACCNAVAVVFIYRWSLSHQSAVGIIFQASAINPLIFLGLGALLAFMYKAFALRIPKWFWAWVIAAALFIPLDLLFVELTSVRMWYYRAVTWFPIIEIVRGLRQAIRNRSAGAWVVGTGMLVYSIFTGSTTLLLTEQRQRAGLGRLIANGAVLLLTITISIFLARRFARTSLHLEEQLEQVKELSAKELEHQRTEAELRLQHAQEKAENERRARELEEARQLQLSMLPKKLPQLPQLDLAAYMKTASEVGGDYYDFHLGADGTLTIAVGDATGHGWKAGTLVAAVKSLFVSLAYHPDIPHILQRMSRVLKEMKLRGLFMALTLVKVQGQQLTVSIAGMPSVLLYRAASGAVEEIALRGLPLGGVTSYQYQQRELTLAAGDAVVLLSDGLPERFNAQGEMLDYAAVQRAFAAAAQHAPSQIIEHLVKVGDDWAEGRAQDDDVTFVVLKVKANDSE